MLLIITICYTQWKFISGENFTLLESGVYDYSFALPLYFKHTGYLATNCEGSLPNYVGTEGHGTGGIRVYKKYNHLHTDPLSNTYKGYSYSVEIIAIGY